MTFEKITDLIHDYMYDSLGELNNSNYGKEIQDIQEKQYKRNWSDNSCYERPKNGKSKTKVQR